ncbi:hypothetical protein JKF63_03356 [Porcisia hertigi]|uniref:Uncharacterized protein n=1 Tax=Porcisia hertigi TaxID=2761500 RepID=A0A836IAH0_9TRYP|nr:hypothetical protein JKF63_03356 [Porcisia hertigi]
MYQAPSPPIHVYTPASIPVTPRHERPPRRVQREGQVRPLSFGVEQLAPPLTCLTYSNESSRGSGSHAPPRSSPIYSSTAVFGDGRRHLAPSSRQCSAWPRSTCTASHGSRDVEEQPCTPLPQSNNCARAAAIGDRGDSRRVVDHADLRALPASTFSHPLTSSRVPSPAIVAALQTAVASSVSSLASTCWICEVWCASGPGSTWPEAPALFFQQGIDEQSVSLLTLCRTCAVAVADLQATPQLILPLCHNTPATRNRTAAYVNAVREYKLLLELMADKVVRYCLRMQYIQSPEGRQPHICGSSGERQSYAGPPRGVDRMPLTSLLPSLQRKVLSQLLEALEDLLKRDQRAVQLAAPRTPLSWQGPPLLCSEVMASRERHVLFEELAHVERQLMSIRSSTTAAVTVPGEPKVSLQSPVGRRLYDPPSDSPAHSRGEGGTAKNGLAHSPCPSAQQQQSPPRLLGFSHVRFEGDAVEPLAAVADSRRHHHISHPRMTSSSQTAPANGHLDTLRRALFPSRSRERSPPELTSPQRGTCSTYDWSVFKGAGSEGDGVRVSSFRTYVNGHVNPLNILPSAATTTRMPFPSSAIPSRQGLHTSGSRHSAAASYFSADSVSSVQDTRLPMQDAGHSRASTPSVLSRSPIDHEGRRAMRALIHTAMWEAYRGLPPVEGESGASPPRCRSELLASDDAGGILHQSSAISGRRDLKSDFELQPWDYFAGRVSAAPLQHIALDGGDGGSQAPPFASCSATSRLLERDDGGLRSSHPPADERSGKQDKVLEPSVFDDQKNECSRSDTAALQRCVFHERQLREEAVEAMLAAQARIAALETITHNMAEKLLTHSLAVTFRAHLEGMELLVGRWTRLAQNFSLQKSLLFADEAAIVVRQLVRERFGVASLWPLSRHREQHRSRRSTPSCVEFSASRDRQEGDELWVSWEEHGASDTGKDNAMSSSSGRGRCSRAAKRANWPQEWTGGEEVQHHHDRHPHHPSQFSSPERCSLQVSPSNSPPPSASVPLPVSPKRPSLSLRV